MLAKLFSRIRRACTVRILTTEKNIVIEDGRVRDMTPAEVAATKEAFASMDAAFAEMGRVFDKIGRDR